MTSLPSRTRVRAEGVSKGGVAGEELTNSESIRFSFRDLVRIMRQELLPLGEQSKTVSKSPPHLHPVIVANVLSPIPSSQSDFQPVHLFRGDLVHLFKAKPSFPCNRIIVRECLSSSLSANTVGCKPILVFFKCSVEEVCGVESGVAAEDHDRPCRQ